jgi:nucleoid-associated protein YgaU
MRNGIMHARVVSDPSGLFAFVPPPLPAGSHEIVLQSIAPDGVRAQSRESLTIVVDAKRDAKPLIALAAPDKPTVVLSQPDAPAEKPATPPTSEPRTRTAAAPPPPAAPPALSAPSPMPAAPGQAPVAKPPASSSGPSAATAPPATPSPDPAAARPEAPTPSRPSVKIVSVEAEEGGRLFVSGKAASGATVRLYLNETLVAPGGAGGDGRVSFAIGRGVRPGGYRVRLDDVDPVSGEVKSRAEVEFKVPAPLTVQVPPAPPPAIPPSPPAAVAASARPDPAPSPRAAPVTQQTASPATLASPASNANSPTAPPPIELAAPPVPAPVSTSEIASTRRATSSPALAAAPPAGSAAVPPQPARAAEGAPTAVASAAPTAPREWDPGTVLIPEINTAIVGRGDNLWRISKRIYGRGLRYTVIYSANQEQIRNPHLIYPGQVFVLPAGGEQNANR